MPPSAARAAPADGLSELRPSGSVTELLFLYECATLEPTQLRPVADRIGLTVQAVSHSFRQLRGRGLVEFKDGRYRPTVEGVAWLHESLSRLGDDVRARIERLHVIRSCRAVALADLTRGDVVSLELQDGRLSARPGGAGPSRGVVVTAGRSGALVEVTDLEGIVSLSPAPVTIRTITEEDLSDPALPRRLTLVLPSSPGLLAAEGLEAVHSLEQATDRPVLRFAAATASLEASRIGVPSTVVVLDRDLPQLLSAFSVSNPPPLDVRPLPPLGRRPRPVRRRGR